MAVPDRARCFDDLAQSWVRVMQRLTPREHLVLRFGLHASHAEEALVTGDIPRARAHFLSMQDIAEKL